MTRDESLRLHGILDAVAAIRTYLARGELSDDLVFDAVCMRFVEIGEAVKDLPSHLRDSEPDLPWSTITGLRDRLAHRYFDTSREVIAATAGQDLSDLEAAATRMLDRLQVPD
ncbi:HepT-like ribonuclease domain-containing protein [Luteipulveratus mongoliensis]|uniref:DUF86 domain-containing protein n=1 Tax=Luteipulveratus mongoliensis TaxID=571913 RepID=A0A0K1JP80_9MICO|nr:HepT-like ribonuclease domain-containing protein [Luteipulveratus mongoliensis]AKU18393.1 hypothetical protein VV02_25345 [Luteipulveratus mongoliensis]